MSETNLLLKSASAISSITSYFTWAEGSDNSSLISDDRMIALGDALQSTLKHSEVEIPRIVVVGTQSSGKSSVLNSLIGMDILPTGKQMVTRTPLHLEIIRSKSVDKAESHAEFGEYRDGMWESSLQCQISFPKPTVAQRDTISEYIEHETCRKAGSQKDISTEPIHLRIVSPNVTNLSLVDLPGLTAVACTDQGQPKDIKEKIERLVESFAAQEKTIILSVMTGRSDLEADMGLEQVKRHDPKGERTVGVLTKLDLMNDETDIVGYLENKVSRDLQLNHGYFAVKNRNSTEKDTLSVEEGLEREKQYFDKRPAFTKESVKTRVGTPSLKAYLSHLLIESMKTALPSIQSGINKELSEIDDELVSLGEAIPQSEEGQISYLHTLLVNFARDFSSCIEARGSSASTGRNIRDILIQCRQDLGEANAFRVTSRVPDRQLQEIIQNSEGNHMSFPYPPVEILERCLQDKKTRPIHDLLKPLRNCNKEVTKELVALVGELIDNSAISRFPELQSLIRKEAITSVIVPLSGSTETKLEEIIQMQEEYIWTDDSSFHEALNQFGKEDYNGDILPALRSLLEKYINCVTNHITDVGPKTVMLHLVRKCVQNLYSSIYPKLASQSASQILQEDGSVGKRRQELVCLRKDLQSASDTIQKMS